MSPRKEHAAGVVFSVLLAFVLTGCGGPGQGAPPADRAETLRPFTHAVTSRGCDRHVGPIRLARPKSLDAHSIGGSTSESIHTQATLHSPQLRSAPTTLDGLSEQGFVHRPTVDGMFYAAHPVDGLTYEQVWSRGGIRVSVSQPWPGAKHLIARLPHSLTRVQIGSSPGWINQSRDWNVSGGPVQVSVQWVTSRHELGSLSARRSPSRLVSIARAYVC
jgi:hypothetical protein